MKAPVFSHLLALFIVAILASNHGRAENESRFTNSPASTGEPNIEISAVTTNAPSAIKRVDRTNPATSSLGSKNVTPPAPPLVTTSHVATLRVSDLREYEAQSSEVKRLLASALTLTTLDLTYKYGSSDPTNGCMDCSGTVYYLLNAAGLKDVPRDASGIYKWVAARPFSSRGQLQSGHLRTCIIETRRPAFWSGTYQVDRDPPVTHVMIYLGINRHSGRRVMVGASDGRLFDGKSRYGVSVFDFTMPGKGRPVRYRSRNVFHDGLAGSIYRLWFNPGPRRNQ